MNKIKLIILCLIYNIIFLVNVNAFELNCEAGTYSYGDTFTCTITDNYNYYYSQVSGTLEYSDGLNCSISEIGQGLTNNINETNKFNLAGYNYGNIILKYSCKVTSQNELAYNAILEINDFKYVMTGYSEDLIIKSDYIPIKAYTKVEEVDNKPRDTSNINSLLNLISDENLDFTFSRFVTKYNISVLYDVSSLNLNIEPYNNLATVRVDGSSILGVGLNVIDIYVTSPDNLNTTCYTLYIKRLARGEEIYYPEKDATLKSMTITSKSNSWNYSSTNAENDEYTIHLLSDENSITVDVIPTVENVDVNISKLNNLVNGDKIKIIITSTDKSNSKTYVINVVKDQNKNDYTYLIILSSIIGGILILLILMLLPNKKKKKKNKIIDNSNNSNIKDEIISNTSFEANKNNLNTTTQYTNSSNVNPTIIVPENTQILPVIPTEPKLPQDQNNYNNK